MEYSPMTMSMKGVFNLLERINLRNTGRSGLDDKVRFENVYVSSKIPLT